MVNCIGILANTLIFTFKCLPIHLYTYTHFQEDIPILNKHTYGVYLGVYSNAHTLGVYSHVYMCVCMWMHIHTHSHNKESNLKVLTEGCMLWIYTPPTPLHQSYFHLGLHQASHALSCLRAFAGAVSSSRISLTAASATPHLSAKCIYPFLWDPCLGTHLAFSMPPFITLSLFCSICSPVSPRLSAV